MDSLIMSKYSGDYIISQYLDTGEGHKTSERVPPQNRLIFSLSLDMI